MLEIILTAISSFIVSGGLTTLVCLKYIKRKSANEVDQGAVNILQDALNELKQLTDCYLELYHKEQSEKKSLQSELSLAETLVCKKMCCTKRDPIQGLGAGFIKCLQEGTCKLDYEPE